MMRKLNGWLLAAALALMPMACSAEGIGANAVLQIGDTAALIGADGTEKVPPGQYAMIVSILEASEATGGIEYYSAFPAAAQNRNLLGYDCLLLDSNGAALTEAVYQYLIGGEDGILFLKDGLYGVMDTALNEIVPCAYTNLVYTGEGYLALTGDPNDDRPDGLYYIDAEGNELPTGIRIYHGLNEITEGLMPVISAENNRTGFVNAKGEWAIQPQFHYAGNFSGGYAVATIESGAGLIDPAGNWLLTPKYRNISVGIENAGIILAETRREVDLIDPNTFSRIKTFTGDDMNVNSFYDNGMAVLYDTDAARLIDGTGQVLFSFGPETDYDTWSDMGDRVIVRRALPGEMGAYLYTLDGELIFGPAQEIWFMGALGGRRCYAYADYEVNVEIEENLDWEGVTEVAGTRRIGIIDEDGRVVLEMGKYRYLEYLSETALIGETESEVGIVSIEDGAFVVSYPLEGEETEGEPVG